MIKSYAFIKGVALAAGLVLPIALAAALLAERIAADPGPVRDTVLILGFLVSLLLLAALTGVLRGAGAAATDGPAGIESKGPLPPPAAGRLEAEASDWQKLVEESVALVRELDGLREDGQPGPADLADHVILRLQQILERCGVETITEAGLFDRKLHRVAPAGPKAGPRAMVAEVLTPGFRVGEHVLLRARVQLRG